jgi:hypothetical protein
MAETVLDTEYGGSCNTASIPSAVLQPILFITTPGADPSTELGDLAERQVRTQRLAHCVCFACVPAYITACMQA